MSDHVHGPAQFWTDGVTFYECGHAELDPADGCGLLRTVRRWWWPLVLLATLPCLAVLGVVDMRNEAIDRQPSTPSTTWGAP